MALDGIFLAKLRQELYSNAVGTRVDKVQQPTKDEIVLHLRSKKGSYMMLFCVRADSPRVHFTSHKIDSPPVPPMFCMLLRKHLCSAMLTDIRQQELDRVLFFDFDATNEIGDKVKLTLCVEIMGKCSNLILVDQNAKIIDCIKRVDITTSSVRQLLPGLIYQLPPKQEKLNLEQTKVSDIVAAVKTYSGKKLSDSLMLTIQGISPIVAREISYRVCDDLQVSLLTSYEYDLLTKCLEEIKTNLYNIGTAYMLIQSDLRPKDFSFMQIMQYDNALSVKEYQCLSSLLDDFYYERDRINRINHRAHELIKKLNNLIERKSRKINIQKEELKKCGEKETLRLYGELIMTNVHSLKKGSLFYDVPNYYDNMNVVKIPCNPALTPTENSNKYYKEYKKAKTAEIMLEKQIEETASEIAYIESVLDEITRADTDAEISAVREELCDAGYLKTKSLKKQKKQKELPAIEYCSQDGYRILVGRNNIQNDKLSLKTADKNDMWLHTQGFPGSHVIIVSKGGEVSDLAIEQAAVIAVKHSKASASSLVPVDYTKVKNLKKPIGAKPGKVIYHQYYTIITNPDNTLTEKLLVKN